MQREKSSSTVEIVPTPFGDLEWEDEPFADVVNFASRGARASDQAAARESCSRCANQMYQRLREAMAAATLTLTEFHPACLGSFFGQVARVEQRTIGRAKRVGAAPGRSYVVMKWAV